MAARPNQILSEILFKQYKTTNTSPIIRTLSNCSPYVTRPIKKIVPKIKLDKNFGTYNCLPLLPVTSLGNKRMNIPLKPIKAISALSKSKNFLHGIKFNPHRQYSIFNKTQIRYYANPNKRWGNQDDGENCEPKRECYRPCPKWQLGNCPPVGNNLDCTRPYIDPCCKKRLAPYPSYSESCAERLEDDPSECMQCPWSRCGGSENIKYPKRKYHTATLAMTRRFKVDSLPVLKITETDLQVPMKCDAKKPPCKRPPGKCDKVQPIEKCPEPKKTPCPSYEEKCKKDYTKVTQALSWNSAFRIWAEKNTIVAPNVLDNLKIAPIQAKDEDPCKHDMVTPANSCCLKLPFDKNEMDYEHKRKRRCEMPKSKKDKKKRDPFRRLDAYSALLDIVYDCQRKIPERPQLPGCDCNKRETYIYRRHHIDKEKMRQRAINRCRRKSKSILDVKNFLRDHQNQDVDLEKSAGRMEMAKEHDKGFPPPCPNWRKPSKQCPKAEKCKKPYRQQHDLNEPFYRRERKPWAEIDKTHGESKPDKIA